MAMRRSFHLVVLCAILAACRGGANASNDSGGPSDTGLGGDASADTNVGDSAADAAPDSPSSCPCQTVPSTCTPLAANSTAFSPSAALQAQFVNVLACATTSIHAAIYETLWNCTINQILARLSAAPSLRIQLVIDDVACPRVNGTLMCPLSRLDGNAQVSIVADNRAALMHHKFMIVDGAHLWLGSANLSYQAFCTDSNDAIIVDDATILAAYEAEFQRMFAMASFGPTTIAQPVTSGAYSAYFSPQSPTTSAPKWLVDMIATIGTATTSIDFAISAWTRQDVADALIAAHARGVTIRGAVDSQYWTDPAVVSARNAGVPIRHGNVHQKLMVIDGMTVITGSANWSMNAWTNNENALWVRNASVVAAYVSAFGMLYAGATP